MYELYYHENINLLMKWESISFFLYFFNKHHQENIHLKQKEKTFFLSNEYYENLVCTFIMYTQYTELFDKSKTFKNKKAAFLAVLYFHIYQEISFLTFPSEYLEYVEEDLIELLPRKLISEKDIEDTLKILSCLNVSSNIVPRDDGFHVDALIVRDILKFSAPIMVMDNDEFVACLMYYGNAEKMKAKSLNKEAFTPENILRSTMDGLQYMTSPYMKQLYMFKIQALEDNFEDGSYEIK